MKIKLLVKTDNIEGLSKGDVVETEGAGENKDQIPAKYINLVELVPAKKLSEKKFEVSTPAKK